MTHVLTADLGNSSLKLRLFRVTEEARRVYGELVRQGAIATAELSAARAWLAEGPAPARAALSSVAEQEAAGEVVCALAEGGAGEVLVAPEPGLRNATREPARVGRDRLYAGRAGLWLADGPAIVLDCGTALTVDAVGPGEPDDASVGVFHGGAIAPGPMLLARAMGEGAAQLFDVEPGADAPALGRDTAEALAAGVVHGLRGAADRLTREVAREAGFEHYTVVLGGGASGLLTGDLERAGAALLGAIVEPDLVHHGLLLALGIEPPRGDA